MEVFVLKATGIVRRIDDLGRIVIPKEIRRTLRIRESESLEIFTDGDGDIILKKYSPMGEFVRFAKGYAESITQIFDDIIVCITDMEQIIAVSGGLKKELLDKKISHELEECIKARNKISAKKNDTNFILISEYENDDLYNYELIEPIIAEGDVLGAVVFLSRSKEIDEIKSKLIKMASIFLGKQIE